MVTNTLGRYFAGRFVAASIAVFAGIFVLLVLVDYIEMVRRTSGIAELSGLFVALCVPVALRRAGAGDRMKPEKRLFGYSVLYLFALFAALVADRMILGQGLSA